MNWGLFVVGNIFGVAAMVVMPAGPSWRRVLACTLIFWATQAVVKSMPFLFGK